LRKAKRKEELNTETQKKQKWGKINGKVVLSHSFNRESPKK
jgi:hypothetical protein